jgi:hypothetical protein
MRQVRGGRSGRGRRQDTFLEVGCWSVLREHSCLIRAPVELQPHGVIPAVEPLFEVIAHVGPGRGAPRTTSLWRLGDVSVMCPDDGLRPGPLVFEDIGEIFAHEPRAHRVVVLPGDAPFHEDQILTGLHKRLKGGGLDEL